VAQVLGLPPFETVLALWQALEKGDVAAALKVVRTEEQAGREPAALYEQLVQLLHALTFAGFPIESAVEQPNGDVCIDVEITSNRGDCLSHIGLAREIAAAESRLAGAQTA